MVVTEIHETHEDQLGELKSNFETLLEKSEEKITAVNKQLTSLLPGAMAEGLSAAYEKKKNEEIGTQEKLSNSFRKSIIFLVLISLVPFLINAYLLTIEGQNIVEVIKGTPSLSLIHI